MRSKEIMLVNCKDRNRRNRQLMLVVVIFKEETFFFLTWPSWAFDPHVLFFSKMSAYSLKFVFLWSHLALNCCFEITCVLPPRTLFSVLTQCGIQPAFLDFHPHPQTFISQKQWSIADTLMNGKMRKGQSMWEHSKLFEMAPNTMKSDIPYQSQVLLTPNHTAQSSSRVFLTIALLLSVLSFPYTLKFLFISPENSSIVSFVFLLSESPSLTVQSLPPSFLSKDSFLFRRKSYSSHTW